MEKNESLESQLCTKIAFQCENLSDWDQSGLDNDYGEQNINLKHMIKVDLDNAIKHHDYDCYKNIKPENLVKVAGIINKYDNPYMLFYVDTDTFEFCRPLELETLQNIYNNMLETGPDVI